MLFNQEDTTLDRPPFEVFVFGDSTHDIVPEFTALLFHQNGLLNTFFDRAYTRIRAELAHLSAQHRATIPPFSNLKELVALHRDGVSPIELHPALTTICQLGLYLSQYSKAEKHCSDTDAAALGLCTGALSAAAISCSVSFQSLVDTSLQTVAVATRLGLLTQRISSGVESAVKKAQSWSFVVPSSSEKDIAVQLDEFVRSKRIAPMSQPYISAYSPSGVTVSGPPNVLEDLRGAVPLLQTKGRVIPLFTAYHATHLYSEADVEWVLETTISDEWASYTARIPVISPVTGKFIWSGNFRTLLAMGLKACLLQPLRYDTINNEICSTLRTRAANVPLKLHAFATVATRTLQTSLKALDDKIVLQDWSASEKEHSKQTVVSKSTSKIAIVGMSGRFPEAENISEFWDLLSQGRDVCQVAPPTRWDVNTHVDTTSKTKNTSAVPWGCWLQNAGLWDPRFFGISPKEAEQCDPQQRLACMAAYEAMEEAGFVLGRTPSTQKERVGVFLGSTGRDWFETNSPQDISTFFISGGNGAFSPGRINYVFNLCGPSYSVDTACSSSLAAAHLACNAIWRGDCDTAITGGTNMCTNPDAHAGLDRGFFLSRTGNCKTFDDGADGYCRGEAAGVLILKRLEDAIADRDPIRGVILGVNTNHSAESEAIMRPHTGAQNFLMNKVLNNAGVDPHDVSYVEMHGTGTQAGDAIEMQSVLETFANEKAAKQRDADHSLYLGSVKSNIGHGEGASGASSLVKVLLMMEHNQITPHCGIKTKINHNFPTNLEERNIHIARKPTKWDRPVNGKRRALVNNFSAAGGNTALLLEDPPIQAMSSQSDIRTSHIITVSAKSAVSLSANLTSMLRFIEGSDKTDKLLLPRLSYTTTARRAHYPHRVALLGSTLEEIKAKLSLAIANSDGKHRVVKTPEILLAFTGQGAQYFGMGHEFYKSFERFRSVIISLDQIGQKHGFPSFIDIIADNEGDINGYEPNVVQLATVALEIGLARLLCSFGISANAVVGHSLGEFAALNVAGVLSDSDTIYLVGTRAQLLQDVCSRGTHSMLAVKASRSAIEQALSSEDFEIACVNGPDAIVLAGQNKVVARWQKTLADAGIRGKVLSTPYAFHSSQVEPIISSFDDVSSGVPLRTPSVPVLSPLDSKVITEVADFGNAYFSRHCRGPVDMESALLAARKANIVNDKTIVIEIGPQPVVSGMINSTLGQQIRCLHLLARGRDGWPLLNTIISAMYTAGADIQWPELHVDFDSAQHMLKLPAYSWDLKNYWMQYTGDWSLRKGLSAADIVARQQDLQASKALPSTVKQDVYEVSNGPATPSAAKKDVPNIESTTIHTLLEETSNDVTAEILVEADITRDDLYPVTQGHKVNGIPLCTPSVYAEIGQNIGKYILDRFRPQQKERLVDVSKLIVEKPLIPGAKSKGPQLIRCRTKVDWVKKTGHCLFYGVDVQGNTHTEYADCTLCFLDASRLETLQNKVPEIKARMKSLEDGVATGTSARFSSAAAYKMVGNLASFHPEFRGVEENILDSNSLEILATLKFDRINKKGKFITHPAAIDALTQPGGFIMNAKDSTDLELEVFVNHGWDSFQIYEPISLNMTYRVYCKMAPRQSSMWAGDNYVFEGDRLVAFFEGITLRKMPRKAFHMILSWTTDQKVSTKTPVTSVEKPTKAKASLPESVMVDKAAQRPTDPVKATTSIIVKSTKNPPASSKAELNNNVVTQHSGKIDKALEIISEESGLALNSLTDDAAFADVGIDSLLSMVIASRFREELDLGFSEEMTIFIDFPTVGMLRTYIQSLDKEAPRVDSPLLGLTSPAEEPSAPVVEGPTKMPLTQLEEDIVERPVITGRLQKPRTTETFDRAMEMIVEESGISSSELTPETNFADVGIDSLLSMVIASRFKEELGVDLDDEMSIFLDFPRVGDLQAFFAGKEESSDEEDFATGETPPSDPVSLATTPESVSSRSSVSNGQENDIGDRLMAYEKSKSVDLKPCKATTSVILQGRPATAKKTIFMLPDGGGSASSYIALPRLGKDIALIGVNCPYARDPENMHCSIESLIDSYLHEIKRRQPEGPYRLGGWSSGGVFAFIAAQRLFARGEEVESLVIIDAPIPNTMDALPVEFFDWAEQLRSADKASTPSYLVPHFKATTDVMVGYQAQPIRAAGVQRPDVLLIWATKGMMSGKNIERFQMPDGASSKGLSFLLDDKTDFGFNGWDQLLPGARIRVEAVEGANHFTLMSNREQNKTYVAEVSKAISSLLSS